MRGLWYQTPYPLTFTIAMADADLQLISLLTFATFQGPPHR